MSIETCGCTDSLATNYYPESTADNGLCEYGCIDQPEGTVIESLESVVVVDTTGNVVIENVLVTETCGCTDNNATNYYPESTEDNGLCEYANDCANQPEGSTATVTTFVPTLVVDSINGSYIVLEEVLSIETCGCTDSSATNYYPESTEDNGLCEYGCTDQPEGTVIESLESVVVIDTTGVVVIENVFVTETCGCTDANATNYYPESTEDNGLCEYANDCANQPEGTTAIVTTFVPTIVVDSIGNTSIVVEEVVSIETCGCTDPSATNYYPESTLDNGLCEYASGCTYAIALNYNPLATTDDGSCLFGGCTDPTASNYQPLASVDDGSCDDEPCDGSVSNFGDLNSDGLVGVSDILDMLTVFGTIYD